MESKTGGGSSYEVTKLNRELDTLKKEKAEVVKKHEQLEEEYVVLKAKLTMEKDDMSSGYGNMKDDYNTIKGELMALRQTYNNKSDEWIKEKLDLEKQVRDLENSIKTSAGNGWDAERNRFKSILDDRDSQITNLKIECDVARSQHTQAKKESEDMKQKLQDYEKMNRYGRSAAGSNSNSDSTQQVDDLKKELTTMEKENKSALNNVKMKYDSKIAIMTEEVHALKSQASKYRRERETYKEMFEGVQKKLTESKGSKITPGDAAAELNDARGKISDMTYELHVLEDELADAKMEAAKSNATMTAQKSNYEIQVSELNSKINEMEEESLIDSGRARIAGTRTKMELAWQKERESQKKLINELNTMARDLKSTLLEVEKERDRERLEGRRKLTAMKGAYDEENDDTKKQITDLQYDLLELRDAHAKLRTTNEKLRRDKEKFERERDEFRYMAKERSRTEQGEEKKVGRLLKDMEDFLNACPQILGEGALKPTGDIAVPTRLDASAKTNFKNLLMKISDSRSELEAIHKMNEEERERVSARRAMMKRTGSVETEGGQDSPRGRTPGASGKHSSSSRFKKSVSIDNTIAESDQLWKSTDSRGSNESLASNASIPLPIPVRTRSAVGGSESGYSSDYNSLAIRRLERDTSVDRLSTGSRESGMSTQSEWVAGEKKKKAGLIGKLKALTKNKDEKEFGSGSDISSVSMTSNMSAFAKAARKRSQSRDRGTSKDREKPKKPEEANQPFDKLFESSSKSGLGPSNTGGASGGTLPRTYRRF